ncbi:MAG: YraN family protein [Pseudooceanicola sp.]
MSYLAGAAAEDSVAEYYRRRGLDLAERRWRGQAGEIDLIFRDGTTLVFVEVKQGPDFDRALAHLGPAQIVRLCRAAEEFAGREPSGSLTDMRFDVGLVNGRGEVRILENALAA